MPATLDTAEPAPTRWGSRKWIIVTGLVGVAIAGALGVRSVMVDDRSSRQRTVAERGTEVMPFDLEATTHIFDPTETGGIQTVVADDPTDSEQIALVRLHLREEVERFSVGDFGDPETIHGGGMPGLTILEAHFDALDMTYQDRADGGRVVYRSSDPAVVSALHHWFDAQVSDHGSHAQGG